MAWDDIKNILSGIFGGVGGGTTQPQQPDPNAALSTPGGPVGGSGATGGAAPSLTSGAPATPPATSAATLPTSVNIAGVGNVPLPKQSFMDNPWLHALLGVYGGIASSPRQKGWGGAIGNAITGGLGQYDAARAAQYAPYKTIAELEKSGAETTLAQATAAKTQQETEKAKNIGANNKLISDRMKQQASQMPPGPERDGMLFQASLLEVDSQNAFKPEDAYKAAKEHAEAFRAQAAAGLSEQTGKLRAEQVQTEQVKQRVLGSEEVANFSRAALNRASTQVLQTGKPMSATDKQKLLQEAGKNAASLVKGTWWQGLFGTIDEAKQAASKQAMDDLSKQLDAQEAQMRSGALNTANAANAGTGSSLAHEPPVGMEPDEEYTPGAPGSS